MELEDELKVKSFPNVLLMDARVATSDPDGESRAVSDVQLSASQRIPSLRCISDLTAPIHYRQSKETH